jgi:DNA-directed RNA polymerase subunit RPC12/RpoP
MCRRRWSFGSWLLLSATFAAGYANPWSLSAGQAQPKPAAPPVLALNENLGELRGVWLMTLPGAKYSVVLRPLEKGRFDLEKAVCFTGAYEIRANRLVLVAAPQPANGGFAWEMRAPDELVLVAQPPTSGGDYLGAILKRQTTNVPAPLPTKARAPRLPSGPALNLADKIADLPGEWLLTMPVGATRVIVVRPLEDQRFRFDKAFALGGIYEIRGNRLTIVPKPSTPDPGFAWEMYVPGELVLVDQVVDPKIGNNYRGATLKRQSSVLPPDKVAARPSAPIAAPPPITAPTDAPASPPARRSSFYLVSALLAVLVLATLAGGVWLVARQRARTAQADRPPARPKAMPGGVTFACHGCERRLQASAAQAGKKVKCPRCGVAVLVPKPEVRDSGNRAT